MHAVCCVKVLNNLNYFRRKEERENSTCAPRFDSGRYFGPDLIEFSLFR